MALATLRLKKEHDRRLRAGHLWVYSNEVDTDATPLQQLSPGQAVEVVTAQGHWLGFGYVNPHSLICARLVSRHREHPLDRSLLIHRFQVALGLRERLYPKPYYRLVYGEGDGLPGLIVDRFDDVVSVQITTAGMENVRQELMEALDRVLAPRIIVLRNDSPVRQLEGLPLSVEVAAGDGAGAVAVIEGEARFECSLTEGQKTGWYFDQRDNRDRMHRYVGGRRVLDLYSYVGAWGIRAAAAGAREVVCVDSSARAVEAVVRNATLNGCQDRVSVLQSDVLEALKGFRAEKERFDVVLVDPPAFIKRRKDMKEGLLAYRRLNQMALQVLARDGILISSSCSYHLSEHELLGACQQSARHLDRTLQVLEQGFQSADHPFHPLIPETRYLKTLFVRVLPTF